MNTPCTLQKHINLHNAVAKPFMEFHFAMELIFDITRNMKAEFSAIKMNKCHQEY